MPPSKIGRYEIRQELGHGGMFTVYRAYDPIFEREVAIKALPREFLNDMQSRERFQRELRTIALLEHPAIVPVYDVGEEEGIPFFVMRYMPGGSFADLLDGRTFSLEETAHIIERIAPALDYAHGKGVIHRDIKPDNILFDDEDNPFISDFGLAKVTERAMSNTGNGLVGTPAYMSPEQVQRLPLDNRSDIYGLGVLVYHMLSGRPPYTAESLQGVAEKHIKERVPEILRASPDLPDAVDSVIKCAMAKDKEKRYPSATALARALNKAAFGNEGLIAQAKPLKKAPSSTRKWTAPIVAGVVVLVILAGMYLLRNQLLVPAEAVFTSTPTETLLPTSTVPPASPTVNPTATETIVPTETVIPFAAQCAAENTTPAPTPAIRVTDKTCKLKVPYTTLNISAGTTFESQSTKMICTQQGINGDKLVIVCTGTPLYSFDLKVCKAPAAAQPTDKCAQGDNYNEAGACCYAQPPADAGCIMYKVDIRGCP